MDLPRFFPDPRRASAQGLVAMSDEITVELLLDAYSHGIFPWSERPARWFSPDPRAVFIPEQIKLPSRFGRIVRRGGFSVTFDQRFSEVMAACRIAHEDEGEWIGDDFLRAYGELHAMGCAHSVEVWQGETLVGGLYGVQVRGLYAGESMFHRVDNASKVAFAYLVAHLVHQGIVLIDAQVLNPHTARLGAVNIPRRDYLNRLAAAMHVTPLYDRARWPAEPVAPPAGLTET